jgi:hypothetical protein
VLIAVNADSNPVDVTFGGLEGWHRATRVTESGAVAIEGARMRDSLAPFGVRVHRLQPAQEFHSRK